MTDKHSSGPWAVEGRGGIHMDGSRDGYTIVDANGRRLHNPFMTKADAAIAAAAPDMLKACQAHETYLAHVRDCNECMTGPVECQEAKRLWGVSDYLRKGAIAKAYGEGAALEASQSGGQPPDRPTITIPRTVQRREDMSPNGRLLVILQEDGDVVLEIAGREEFGERERATAEFCAGGGGGQSPRTVEALKLLMAAMQADNDAGGRSRDYERQYHFTLRPEDQDWSK